MTKPILNTSASARTVSGRLSAEYQRRQDELSEELGDRTDPEAMRRRDNLYVRGGLARRHDPEVIRLRRAVRRDAGRRAA